MEIAGLGVSIVGLAGLASLVSTCLDTLDKVDAYRMFGLDSSAMALCFEADKHRLRRWLHAVGIVNGRVAEVHHPLLDDVAVEPLVHRILASICNIWAAASGSSLLLDADISESQMQATLPGGGRGAALSAQPPPRLPHATKRHALAAKKMKIGWALGGKAKFAAQLESFEALVNRLYSLVPPLMTGNEATVGHSVNTKLFGDDDDCEYTFTEQFLNNY
jgi:hypothetical protein